LGARVTVVDSGGSTPFATPDASADVVVGLWSTFRGAVADEIAQASRVLRPGGRLLAVHHYGRDDVSEIRGPQPEYGPWTRRDGPFLRDGFKIRVLHCWWTFASTDEARTFLESACGDAGRAVADRLTRPRLSYNVAVYHRTLNEEPASTIAAPGAAPIPRPTDAHIAKTTTSATTTGTSRPEEGAGSHPVPFSWSSRSSGRLPSRRTSSPYVRRPRSPCWRPPPSCWRSCSRHSRCTASARCGGPVGSVATAAGCCSSRLSAVSRPSPRPARAPWGFSSFRWRAPPPEQKP